MCPIIMKREIAVLGAGSWGTALAINLAEKGCRVVLWVRREEYRKEMEAKRENTTYLPGFPLPSGIALTSNIAEAVNDVGVVLGTLPSHAVRSTISALAKNPLAENLAEKLWVSATKGIEEKTSLTMSEVMRDALGLDEKARNKLALAAISGPSFAKEVAEKKPTAVVAASENNEVAKEVQEIFSTPFFRVYTHSDILGVEIGGAVKNVMAIATGICDGLGLGMNARSALITRGLHEIVCLGRAMGAKAETFSGLSGVGDLVLTCTGSLSRNRQVGMRIGQGEKLPDILNSMAMVAEGVKCTVSVLGLGEKYGIDMPITNSVYEILFCEKHPRDASIRLMNRVLKEEMEL